MTRLSHPRIAVALAVVLSLALALPAAAATTATRNDQVTVLRTLTVTVDTNWTTYQVPGRPDMEPGQTSAEQGLTVNVGGNSPWKLTVAGTPLVSGGDEIAPWLRTVRVGGDARSLENGMQLSSGIGPVAVETWWSLTVPGDQPNGHYTGTLTFTVALQ